MKKIKRVCPTDLCPRLYSNSVCGDSKVLTHAKRGGQLWLIITLAKSSAVQTKDKNEENNTRWYEPYYWKKLKEKKNIAWKRLRLCLDQWFGEKKKK